MTGLLALVGLNNSHPYIFGGLLNGGVRDIFTRNAPKWTHSLFPDYDWEGLFCSEWRFTRAWARDKGFAEKVVEAVRVEKVVDSLEEAVFDTSGAFVCDMWGEYHLCQTIPFLKQGKPVFVDKPLAESVVDAKAMIETAIKHDTVLSTCSSLRFDGNLQRLKKKLASKIGKPSIITVCCPCHQDLARYTVHGIEVLLELTGNVRVAGLRNIGPGLRRHLILIDFVDGMCGVIHSWDNHACTVTVTGGKGQEMAVLRDTESTKKMVAAILKSFESKKPVVPYDEALEVVRVIEAAALSQACGGKLVAIDK